MAGESYGVYASVAGAATSAVSAWYGAKMQQDQLRAQADIADINARVAELGAESAMSAGIKTESGIKLRTAQIKSSQRAHFAANGIDLGEGSAANVLTTTDVMGEIDANTAHLNAIQAAWGYRTQATNYQTESISRRGTANGISPGSSATTSLIGSGGQVASSWYAYDKAKSGAK